uniref:F-box domain-containing protein n=1 Tax=Schistosoma mansoni TaxID=6183 RepID=A0A3Q0KTY4_SCHMA
MHSCLTLVDYTWKDSEESGTSTPKYTNHDHIIRLRRTARSLDGDTLMNSSLNQDATTETNGQFCRHLNDMLNRSLTQITDRDTTHHHRHQPQQHRRHHSSMLLLNNRRLPIYATKKQLLKRPDHIWVPVGHCRYLLERDLCTGEIQWNPEGNEILCTPRSLAEICMARLIRDWPCMLPTRRSSLRNIVSFLFSSRDIQSNTTQNFSTTTSSSTTSTSIIGPRRSASLSSRESRCKTSHCQSQNRKLTQNHSIKDDTNDDDDDDDSDKKKENTCTNTLPLTCHDLPVTVLINLLSEAILQRDCAAITGLIANWPCEQLIIKQLIPNEEYPLSLNYMTKPTFVLVSPDNGNRNTLVKGPSLLDGFILGLLTRQSGCKLKSVDFTGFEEDCRVSIELSRLPILWMKPENRNSESVRRHLMASLHIGIPRKRLEAYFSRISTIYAFHEADIGHGEQFDTVTIHLDCNMTVDEVALGLSLQTLTPFRFSCNRLLLQRLPEINFPPYSLIRLFDPLSITQFEMEDPTIGSSIAVVLPSAVGWLISLRNLRACSLPSCIPPPPDVVPNTPTSPTLPTTIVVSNTGGLQSNSSQQSNTMSLSSSSGSSPSSSSSSTSNTNNTVGANSSNNINTSTTSSSSMSSTTTTNNTLQNFVTPAFTSTVAACRLLNRALVSLRYLQRLGLARCHLTGQLKTLLGGLSQPLEYLNLQDCCLSSEDIHYLVHQWRPLHGLYELNLSRNNLSVVPEETLYELVQNVCLKPRGRLVCLSIAYTCLSTERLIDLLSLMAGMDPSHSLNENDEQENIDTQYTNKWMDKACTLRVLCIQSFIPPSQLQIHRILYRITRLTKLYKLHIFPAFYAFPGDTEEQQRELRYNQLIHSRHYLKQRCRSDIELL